MAELNPIDTTERPQYSEDAEHAVLSAMLMDGSAIDAVLNMIDAAMFYDERHALIFAAIVALHKRGTVVDPLTLSEELLRRDEIDAVGGKEYIGFLVDAAPTSANVEYHAVIVRDYADRRAAGDAGKFQDLADGQVARADDALTLTPSNRLRFRPTALHRIARFLVPGQFIVITAATGIGKTTFLLSTADDFILDGKRVAILGLEQEDHELRTAFACLRANVPRHIAIENSWLEHADGKEMFARVKHQLEAQSRSPMLDQLLLLPHRYIDTKTLVDASKQAGKFGADVLIVDHLNHIKTASGSYKEWTELVQTSKKVAEDFGFVNASAAQINREAMKGGHRLTRYMPAQLHQIQGGGVIEQNAVVALNLYRPVIVPKTDYEKNRVKAAMKGEIEPGEVLQPYRMGVSVMKHRVRGELEGKRCILALEDGKLKDPPNWEQDAA